MLWGCPRPPESQRFFDVYQELNPSRRAGPSGCPSCCCARSSATSRTSVTTAASPDGSARSWRPTTRVGELLAERPMSGGCPARSGPRVTSGYSADGAGVDLVEVTDPVADTAATRPLPHQRLRAGPGHPAEEAGAGRRAPQAPADRGLAELGGLRLVRPLVGVPDHRVNASAEDRGPDARLGVDAGGVAVGLLVVEEAVEVGPVDARRDVARLDDAAAR